MSEGSWTPLLSGSTAAQAVTVAVEVAEAVETLGDTAAADGPLPVGTDLSLAGGAAGFAVLNAYLALALNDATAASRAQTWIRRAVVGLRARPTGRRKVRACR